MKFAVKSDSGKVRKINEDSFNIICGHPGVPAAFIIADGMGGHNSGEVASKAAVEFAGNYLTENPLLFSEASEISGAIRELMEKANLEIYAKSSVQGENFGMGTTMIIAVSCGEKLYIGHVGDSRAYFLRDGKIEQITTDHSYVEELVRNGSLTREEASNHPQKNVITRALGCSENIAIDTYTFDVQPGDYFVLCTDGLTNKLEENEIKEVIEKIRDPEPICEELVARANEKGGEDNITVIVIKNE